MSEPRITINGTPLDDAQAATVRCALEALASQLNESGLGDDEHGRVMTVGYLSCIDEMRRMYKS